jgi:hypothetical protein
MNESIPPEVAWLEDPVLIAAIHCEVRQRVRNRRLYRLARCAATGCVRAVASVYEPLFRARPLEGYIDWGAN